MNSVVVLYFADLHQLDMPSLPKLLVFVNPLSGPGRALHIFQQSVVPVFAEAGLQYHLIVTGYFDSRLFLSSSMNSVSVEFVTERLKVVSGS